MAGESVEYWRRKCKLYEQLADTRTRINSMLLKNADDAISLLQRAERDNVLLSKKLDKIQHELDRLKN